MIPLKGDPRNMASHASRLYMRLYCILFCPELTRRALERLLSINVALNKQDSLPSYMESFIPAMYRRYYLYLATRGRNRVYTILHN